jgi:cardiolipin synthase
MNILKKIFNRATIMAAAVLLEVLIIYGLFAKLGSSAGWIEGVLRLLSLVIIMHIVRTSLHLSSDMMWILVIVALPVPGTIIYLCLGANLLSSKVFRHLVKETETAKKYYVQDEKILQEAEESSPSVKGQLKYISAHAGFPVYRNQGVHYYKLGDEGYPVMLKELKKAEKFIFLEYFIIEEGVMWNGILDILKEKVKQGVEVRVMYDDMGSFVTVPAGYAKQLETFGIQCVRFNAINPIINIVMNHRDHRKILVIDGKVGFTGGINLADEYINVKTVHGHWKDSCIMIQGEAVWSLECMFLTSWNAHRHQDTDYEKYHVHTDDAMQEGYIAPYGETPLDGEITGQNIYMNIINQAQNYCYIYTPYLIIDTELSNAMILAAQRGVDIRLITPGIPDKKIVWDITRSYYKQLIKGGVKIYEYTPGFVHAKVFVSDDEIATVGTLNLDYRSLYLHFENGIYLYHVKEIAKIRDDYLQTIQKCHQMTAKESTFGAVKTIFISIVRIFAPMM